MTKLLPRLLAVLLFAVSMTACFAQEVWMGIYMQGVKIGYTSYSVADGGTQPGASYTSSSMSVLDTSMLGAGLRMDISSSAEYTEEGSPLILTTTTESAGRTNIVVARFDDTQIHIEASFDGRKTTKTLPLPTDAPITDDPTNLTQGDEIPEPGTRYEMYTFDSNALVLLKVAVVFIGETTIEVNGQELEVFEVRIEDPRASTTMYIDAEGEMILGKGPMGMEMRAEPKEVAMDLTGNTTTVDLAQSSSIRPDRPIENYRSISSLKLQIEGVDLSHAPSDEHQTVVKEGDVWIVTIHPAAVEFGAAKPISVVGPSHREWTLAESRIPSDSEKFMSLAASIVGDETNTLIAADLLRDYVNGTVRANAGIGLMRDADEILESAEGVCRDHAVLLATLTRAANIPTRFVTGLTYGMGAFYYHMWVEVYTGEKWVAMDSTIPQAQVPAVHIKMRSGKLEDTMYSFLIDGARIKVID